MSKPLFVEWCAKDVLDGTAQMDALTELAYRRVIDMIYSSNDTLRDNDEVMQYATKTGKKWKAIKKELVEVYGKIFIENGYIRQAKCTEKLAKSRANIQQKADAALAMHEKRKSLKENKSPAAAAPAPVHAAAHANQEPNNQVSTNPLTPIEETTPDSPVSFSKTATRSTPWFEGKVITWSAGEYDDAMKNHEVTEAQIDAYLKSRDKWYTTQPERIQRGWMLATIKDFAQQFGTRKH